MTNFEDPLTRALHEVPTNGQRPLELIERRARTFRRRRRATVAGVAVAAAGAIAVPSLAVSVGGLSQDVGPAAPATTTAEAQQCDLWESERHGDYVALAEVPDQLRLVWAEDAAPPPTQGSLVDFTGAEEILISGEPADCAIPEDPYAREGRTGVHVLTLADDVVTRAVTVFGPSGEPSGQEGESRVLETAAGPVVLTTMLPNRLQAVWPSADGTGDWVSWIDGDISDAELIDLAESVRLVDDGVDAGNWSGAGEQSLIVRANQSETHPDYYETGLTLDGQPVSLSAWQGPFSQAVLWEDVELGDHLVDVNGRPGLLRTGPTGQLRWVTDAGVLVELRNSGRDGQADLVEVARSVQPVPADDERLTAVWQEEPDE